MTPAARIAAAIEVLTDIEARRRPAADAMKDWGLSHRFAGSGDRAAISSLVYDALRKKSSSAWIMGDSSPRAEILGALRQTRGLDVDGISALFSGEGHAPMKLAEAERARLASADLSGAPPHVLGDFPEWLTLEFEASFAADAADEGRALAERAPVDLRAILLKSRATGRLPRLPISLPRRRRSLPLASGSRCGPTGVGRRSRPIPPMSRAWWKCRTRGRELAALIADAKPGMQVLDLCAGAGGSTLALAASMQNQGQIYAANSDPKAPRADLHEARPIGRAQRPGARAPRA